MFQVLYLCWYRPHWYDDIELIDDLGEACAVANQVAANRRTVAIVCDAAGNRIYEVDQR